MARSFLGAAGEQQVINRAGKNACCRARLLDEFAGVQDSIRVQGALNGLVESAGLPGNGHGPPALFGEADPMFAGDRSAPGNDLPE